MTLYFSIDFSTSYILTWPEEDFVAVCSTVEENPKRTELSQLREKTFCQNENGIRR